MQIAEENQILWSRGGFSLKDFTFSGRPPLDSLSSINKSIYVADMKWYLQDEKLSLNMTKLNVNTKHQGKRLEFLEKKQDSKHPTHHRCVSKVPEIYDLVGKTTFWKKNLKCDLHELVIRNLDWDDKITDDLRLIWKLHLSTPSVQGMQLIRCHPQQDTHNLSERKVVTHVNWFSLDQNLFRNPRLNCLQQIVKRSLKTYRKSSIKLGDNQIFLHWLHNESKPLKQ